MNPASIPSGLFTDENQTHRCSWCETTPAYRRYHDTEWGFPVSDDRRLFEKICLEGFQAGLS
jgi:DNA-3-methyladenine glycosylase I